MKVLAICCADLHLTLTAPVARSVEPDWLAAQGRVLMQVAGLVTEYKVPVIYAGDIFDKPNPSPELINWAIFNLAPGWGVPGQHDLACHRYEDVRKSAYWTLGEAGIVADLGDGSRNDFTTISSFVNLYGFPFGRPLHNVEGSPDNEGELFVAVIHRYVWKQGATYDGSPPETRYHHYKQDLLGYHAAIFGDNHKGFSADLKPDDEDHPTCQVYNCGCLIRRKSDERNLRPAVGLLLENGRVERHFLDVSKDQWADVDPAVERLAGADPAMDEFLAELGGLEVDSLDFREAICRYIRDKGVAKGVEAELLEGL